MLKDQRDFLSEYFLSRSIAQRLERDPSWTPPESTDIPLDSKTAGSTALFLAFGMFRGIKRRKEQASIQDAVDSSNHTEKNDSQSPHLSPDEEALYEKAFAEVKTGNVVTGVMAKAMSDTDGDEKKANARYLKIRVAQMMKDEVNNLLTQDLTPQQTTEIVEALASGGKIEAIKLYRTFTGNDLKDSKKFIEILIPQLVQKDPIKFAELAKRLTNEADAKGITERKFDCPKCGHNGQLIIKKRFFGIFSFLFACVVLASFVLQWNVIMKVDLNYVSGSTETLIHIAPLLIIIAGFVIMKFLPYFAACQQCGTIILNRCKSDE